MVMVVAVMVVAVMVKTIWWFQDNYDKNEQKGVLILMQRYIQVG